MPPALAAKLDCLFRTVPPPGKSPRREYTYREAVDAIRRLTGPEGPTISPTYLWELRTGRRGNPTLRHVAALSALFGVPPGYFFHDALSHQIDQELDLLLALRDPGVRDLARRAAGLSQSALAALAGMADHARRLEGLPPAHSADTSGAPASDPPLSDARVSGDEHGRRR